MKREIEICERPLPFGSIFFKNKKRYIVYKIENHCSYGVLFSSKIEFSFAFKIPDPAGMIAVVDQLRNAYPFEVLASDPNVLQISKLLEELEKVSENILAENKQ